MDAPVAGSSGTPISPRRTRQRTKATTTLKTSVDKKVSALETKVSIPAAIAVKSNEPDLRSLPENPSISITKLAKNDHKLLLKKHNLLKTNQIIIPRDIERNGLSSFIMATLVFAQEEAGTAVCISADGILLTCSHCVAESAEEFDGSRSHWLIFASGQIVESKAIAWDPKRDLALLKIVAAQADLATGVSFPFMVPADAIPAVNSRLLCVGHPGSEDLEADEPGVKTDYDVLHLSAGSFKGYAEGQDLQDNSEIGALMHNCWTYWGHSGAPLIDRRAGRLVGLHSSWDDETSMRRGVPLEAIVEFLEENKSVLKFK